MASCETRHHAFPAQGAVLAFMAFAGNLVAGLLPEPGVGLALAIIWLLCGHASAIQCLFLWQQSPPVCNNRLFEETNL